MRAVRSEPEQRFAARPGLQLLLFTGLVAALLTLVGAALAWRSYQNQRDRAIADTATLADRTAADAERLLADRLATLQAMAAAPPVRDGDRAAMLAYFTATGWQQLGLRGGVGWADRSGLLRVATNQTLDAPPVDLSDRDHVRAVLATDRPYVGRVVVGRVDQVLLVPLAVPTHDAGGALSGVLIGTVWLDRQETFIRDLGPDGAVIVLDRANQIISERGPVSALTDASAAPPLPRLRASSDGVLVGATGLRGESNRLIGFAEVPTGGWVVLVDRSLPDALDPARRVLAGELGGLLLLAVVGMGGVGSAARRLDRTAARERAANEARTASEAKFAAAFALSPQAISITAIPSGQFIEVNDALLRLSGYAREEVIGRTPGELGLWADREAWERGREAIAREGRLPQGEARFRRKDGGVIIGLAAAERITIGDQPAILTVIADITDRRRVEDRARLLAEVGALLAGTLDEAVALAGLARLLVRDLADWCLISTLESDGLVHRRAFAHADPAREALLRDLPATYPYDPAQPYGVIRVIASGEPRFSPALTAAELANSPAPPQPDTLQALGTTSGMIVPLRARGATFGAISLLRADVAHPFTEADLALAEQIADRAAVALDNARLYAAERAARDAAERAARRQAALAEGSRLFAEADAALEPLLGATARYLSELIGDGCLVGLIDDRSEEIVVTATAHRDPEAAEYSRTTLASTPMRVGVGTIGGTAQTGQPVLDPVVDQAAILAAAEPALRPVLERYAPRSLMVAPCRAGARTIAVIALARHTPDRPYTPDDLALLTELADRAGLAIERARLYEAERLARARAEAAQARLALLADAGALLAGSLDEDAIVATLERLIVPAFADWYTLNLLGDDGLRPPLARHADPARQPALDELLRRYPASAEGEGSLARVMRTGEPLLLVAPDDGPIMNHAPREGEAALLAEIGLASTMVVPLAARDHLLGALRLARTAASPRFDADDLQVARVLAGRAAFALDNARLYRATRDAVAARDRFLSIAAHELRTPVTSMRAYGQLARRQRDRGQLGPELLDNALAALERGTSRLNTLIQDLLDVARLQSGQLRVERAPLDLVALLEMVVGEARAQFPPELRLTLACDAPTYTVEGDAGRLEQVLGNLLENARKYSPDGGTVAVTLATDAAGATIAVRDEGIGLGPGEAERVFTPFNRSEEALKRQIQGLGLGLAICRAIVAEHGGTLAASSAGSGQGTTFTLRLPAPGAAAAPLAAG